MAEGGGCRVTKNEASERYLIPIEILKEYEKWDLYGGVKKYAGEWQYDEEDLECLGNIMTLHSFGFGKKEVEHYIRLELHGAATASERIQMLQQKRAQVLDKIHIQEKKIDGLDYLIYRMQIGRK